MKDLSKEPEPLEIEMPAWADEVIAHYQSDASNQFVLYGNIDDRFVLLRSVREAMRDCRAVRVASRTPNRLRLITRNAGLVDWWGSNSFARNCRRPPCNFA